MGRRDLPRCRCRSCLLRELFGWDAEKDERPEAGGYTMFSRNGKHVAAASPPQQEGIPPHWTVYLATDDVDATASAVREAGGAC